MRYIIETTQQGVDEAVWNTINSLKDKGLINVVEKGDPIENMKEDLRRVARSLELLNKVGIDKELTISWIKRRNPALSIRAIEATLSSERDFFKRLGVELK